MNQQEFALHLQKLAHEKAVDGGRLGGGRGDMLLGKSLAYDAIACFLTQNELDVDGIVVPRETLVALVGLAETVDDVDEREAKAVRWGQEKVYETIPQEVTERVRHELYGDKAE